MNTKTFQLIIQQRVSLKLKYLRGDEIGHTQDELHREVARVVNRFLIEEGLNHSLWSRVYRNRVFLYNINTRRAVIELGCDTNPVGTSRDGRRLFSGFELHLFGGIYNKPVPTDLMTLANQNDNTRREKQYA